MGTFRGHRAAAEVTVVDCQRCGGAGHADAECSLPETGLMALLRGGQGLEDQEWKPTEDKRLDLGALVGPEVPLGVGAPLRVDTPTGTGSGATVSTGAGAPLGVGTLGVWRSLEPAVLVALGVALSALLVLAAVAWVFL